MVVLTHDVTHRKRHVIVDRDARDLTGRMSDVRSHSGAHTDKRQTYAVRRKACDRAKP